ncbi:MAG: histidine kinase, partial [Verrucomicrobiota bacterium]
ELIPARDWLMRLDQRRQLLQEQKQIEENLLVAEARAAGTRRLYLLVGAASLVGLLLLVSFLVLRSRRAAAGELRERIANDLHDEIGSTLGSIALNADVLSRAVESPDTGSRLATMAGRAREASQTMRDLVWVVDSRTDDSVNLLERLRSTAAELLGDISHRFEVPEPFPRLRLSPEQKRHLLLFVKESLHNVLRHAEASEVVIAIKKVNHDWQFAVSDDGTGFDFDQSDHEQLDRLRSRATRLGGELRVDSTRGSGTTVSIRVPTSAKAIRSAV